MNNSLEERIAQFRKMTTELPDDDLGHFRLGQLLLDDGQYEEAAKSFRRTLELSPQFSKVFQLLGTCLIKLGKKSDAIKILRDGFVVADERGDNIPRDEMVKLLKSLDEAPPESKRKDQPLGGPGGFRCQRPGCVAGQFARQLKKPPINDELGKKIYEQVCADCWEQVWLKNLSVKVINEMRLDLSTERGCEVYDQIMRETLGIT
jgi:Fe-S cluster biosynthesis and repair protein YggX